MQDDLKFASEAISQIALQAMKSIESLYANRLASSDSSDSNFSPKVNTSNCSSVSPKVNDSDTQRIQDARYSMFDETPKKVNEVEKVEISKPKVERPPKYDSDLENLLL